ncbi:MAG: hypothetical protein Q8M15_15780 [Bacteroidota bacterium]|nr:hypothetical protein [Bacteroidota bacterium]
MKTNYLAFIISVCVLSSCSKNEASKVTPANTIITSDSSAFNGRLIVTTYDYFSGTKLYGTDVFLYTNYDDIKRNLYLLYLKSTSASAEADFGYLLQGNYYIRSQSAFKTDTALVQILGKRTVNRNVYLK